MSEQAGGSNRFQPQTRVAVHDGRWTINGDVTYPESAAEGLLMNVRMVNAVFEDRNPDTCPDGFDPDANTTSFISSLPAYVEAGMLAFTVCLQGGLPGYEGALNSAFVADGSLRPDYLDRVARVIEACDGLGAVVILGCFYQRQDQVVDDAVSLRSGIVHVVDWLSDQGYTNVVLELANEYTHRGFSHGRIRTADGMVSLLRLAKEANRRLLVSASGEGHGRLDPQVAENSDFLLIHFNNTPVEEIGARVEALRDYGKPIICNEDDKVGDEGASAARASVRAGCSWGFMHSRVNQYYPFAFDGPDDDPAVYGAVRELTGRRDPQTA
jgi:hypothetical protein